MSRLWEVLCVPLEAGDAPPWEELGSDMQGMGTALSDKWLRDTLRELEQKPELSPADIARLADVLRETGHTAEEQVAMLSMVIAKRVNGLGKTHRAANQYRASLSAYYASHLPDDMTEQVIGQSLRWLGEAGRMPLIADRGGAMLFSEMPNEAWEQMLGRYARRDLTEVEAATLAALIDSRYHWSEHQEPVEDDLRDFFDADVPSENDDNDDDNSDRGPAKVSAGAVGTLPYDAFRRALQAQMGTAIRESGVIAPSVSAARQAFDELVGDTYPTPWTVDPLASEGHNAFMSWVEQCGFTELSVCDMARRLLPPKRPAPLCQRRLLGAFGGFLRRYLAYPLTPHDFEGMLSLSGQALSAWKCLREKEVLAALFPLDFSAHAVFPFSQHRAGSLISPLREAWLGWAYEKEHALAEAGGDPDKVRAQFWNAFGRYADDERMDGMIADAFTAPDDIQRHAALLALLGRLNSFAPVALPIDDWTDEEVEKFRIAVADKVPTAPLVTEYCDGEADADYISRHVCQLLRLAHDDTARARRDAPTTRGSATNTQAAPNVEDTSNRVMRQLLPSPKLWGIMEAVKRTIQHYPHLRPYQSPSPKDSETPRVTLPHLVYASKPYDCDGPTKASLNAKARSECDNPLAWAFHAIGQVRAVGQGATVGKVNAPRSMKEITPRDARLLLAASVLAVQSLRDVGRAALSAVSLWDKEHDAIGTFFRSYLRAHLSDVDGLIAFHAHVIDHNMYWDVEYTGLSSGAEDLIILPQRLFPDHEVRADERDLALAHDITQAWFRLYEQEQDIHNRYILATAWLAWADWTLKQAGRKLEEEMARGDDADAQHVREIIGDITGMGGRFLWEDTAALTPKWFQHDEALAWIRHNPAPPRVSAHDAPPMTEPCHAFLEAIEHPNVGVHTAQLIYLAQSCIAGDKETQWRGDDTIMQVLHLAAQGQEILARITGGQDGEYV